MPQVSTTLEMDVGVLGACCPSESPNRDYRESGNFIHALNRFYLFPQWFNLVHVDFHLISSVECLN